MKRLGTRLQAAICHLADGRVLGRIGGRPVLLVETAGRRTGRRQVTPVQYLADADASVVVACNAGRDLPPHVPRFLGSHDSAGSDDRS